jgi:hypothetical protein
MMKNPGSLGIRGLALAFVGVLVYGMPFVAADEPAPAAVDVRTELELSSFYFPKMGSMVAKPSPTFYQQGLGFRSLRCASK